MKKLLPLTLFLALGASHALGDIIINFASPDQTGSPGDTLVFFGTLANTDASAVFLNSGGANLSGNSFAVDFNDPFSNNVPFSLDAGASTGSIELLDVTIDNPVTDPAGYYGGTYTLLGGVDGGSQDVLATFDFSVTIGTSSATPEPSTLILLCGSVIGYLILRRTNGALG